MRISAFLLYAALIYAGEITLGNSYFPLYLWSFEGVPAVFWSVPVHLAGYFWILYVVQNDPAAPSWLSALRGTGYFAFGEILNLFALRIFSYRSIGGTEIPAFLAVLFLYWVLCLIVVKLIRPSAQ